MGRKENIQMMLKVLKYPHPNLRKVSEPLKPGSDVSQLAEDMWETMMICGGIGLAAPQVGQNVRLIVLMQMDISNMIDQQYPYCALINPVILSKSGKMIEDTEFCLSVPGKGKRVRRYEQIRVSYTNLEGKEVVVRLDGLKARCVQHEIDHLDGKLILD
jgi:peptide deformylase